MYIETGLYFSQSSIIGYFALQLANRLYSPPNTPNHRQVAKAFLGLRVRRPMVLVVLYYLRM